MSEKAWFLHVAGEVLGPLSTSLMTKMLQQNRCNAGDFVCCDGMNTWTRIADCDEFTSALPPTPRMAVPKGTATAAPLAAAAQKAPKAVAPASSPTPIKARVETPKHAPTPEPVEVEAPKNAPLTGTVKIGTTALKTFEVTETSITFEKGGNLEVGSDVKIKIEAAAFGKAMDLTGVVSTETDFQGKAALCVEFTRMNPAHRRTISTYLTGTATKKAA